jgi:hypothetical protein
MAVAVVVALMSAALLVLVELEAAGMPQRVEPVMLAPQALQILVAAVVVAALLCLLLVQAVLEVLALLS